MKNLEQDWEDTHQAMEPLSQGGVCTLTIHLRVRRDLRARSSVGHKETSGSGIYTKVIIIIF